MMIIGSITGVLVIICIMKFRDIHTSLVTMTLVHFVHFQNIFFAESESLAKIFSIKLKREKKNETKNYQNLLADSKYHNNLQLVRL